MLQSIRVTPGERMLLREKPDPASPHLLRFFGGEAVDLAEPQPAIPAGAPGTAADWAFATFQGQSGWVERRFVGEAQAPVQAPLNQADFVKECIRAEIDSNAGGNDDGFPVDADYLVAWALIASDIANLPPDPANDGADGPFALTDADWKDYLANVPPEGEAANRKTPLMHVYPAAYLSRKRMQALSEKLTDPALQDGPYIPTYLNVFHAQMIGVDAAAEVQKLLTAKEGATTMDTLLAKAVPDQAARDALTNRHARFLKDGANSQTVDAFRSKTSRLLNDRFTRAFKLIKQLAPESIPPKADIGAMGSWLEAAEKELKEWEARGFTHNTEEGRKRVLQYFKATDLETDKVLSWCGAFVAHCLKMAGDPAAGSIIKGASWAANWKGWGDTKLFLRTGEDADGIPKGAIVLLEPLVPKASGHVGFFHSLKEGNKIVLLGGNQSRKVCLRAFPRGKLVAIRWLAAAPKADAPANDAPVTSGPTSGGSTPGSGTQPPGAGATNQDVLTLARTLFGEARGEFDAGGKGDVPVEAVANVIVNRAAKKFRGKTTVHGVCRDPLQFSCWNGNDANRARIMNLAKGANAVFDRCLKVATRAVKGEIPDHTGGALHYHATSIAKPRWVVKSPNARVTLKIGRHIFYTGIK
jgi:uncharacterized protein (TIGR02594 family)